MIDPARLTWVERSTHDLAERSHASSRWSPTTTAIGSAAQGSYRFEPIDDALVPRGTARPTSG